MLHMELKLKVYAVIVSFNPDLNVFGKNLATISRQVDKIIELWMLKKTVKKTDSS